MRSSKAPELPVILLEDFGALIGLSLALLGVGLMLLTGNPIFDVLGLGAASVCCWCSSPRSSPSR